MKTKILNAYKSKQMFTFLVASILSLILFGCGGDDNDSGTGYIQLYNLSSNAPGIYLTVDKYDDDDYDESTHSPVLFTNVSNYLTYDNDTYDIELAWQDEYNNVTDLEIVHESQLEVTTDTVEFIVVADDIQAPTVLFYEIPVRDDDELDDDSDNEVFNIRVVNMHPVSGGVDIYYSESDETFNEATLFNQTSYGEMSENQKIDQEGYIFYLTYAGSNEVLFTSEDIDFPYASAYIFSIRENTGVGSSPFLLDIISTSSVTEYTDINAEASFRIFNGIVENDNLYDLSKYEGRFDFHINDVDDSPEVSALSFGEFSDSIVIASGDYSMNLVTPVSKNPILSNHLLALSENTDKTVFFYLLEEAVDEDGDGDIDEDGNGTIDELEITLNSLVVDDNLSSSIYSHQMKVINLIDQDEIIDDFSSIKVYFVRSDEIISTAEQYITAIFATPSTVELLNNTYTVYVIGKLDSSDIILSSSELILNEDSKDQFIILDKDANSASGYRMSFNNQTNK
jgi:hypothetical protein